MSMSGGLRFIFVIAPESRLAHDWAEMRGFGFGQHKVLNAPTVVWVDPQSAVNSFRGYRGPNYAWQLYPDSDWVRGYMPQIQEVIATARACEFVEYHVLAAKAIIFHNRICESLK